MFRSERLRYRPFAQLLCIALLGLSTGCRKKDLPAQEKTGKSPPVAEPSNMEAASFERQAQELKPNRPAYLDSKWPKESAQAQPNGVGKQGQGAQRPLYYDRAITAADLQGRTLREFSLLRNTIYARAGNQFRKTWLDQHFRALPWYKPSKVMRVEEIRSLDRDNIETIVQAEEAVPKETLDERRNQLLAKSNRDDKETIELRLLSARLGKWDDQIKDPKRTPLEDPRLLDKILKLQNLEEMSRRDLRILRNTIYARRGRRFSSELVSSFFYQKDWYKPNENFSASMLTSTDRKNIRIVRSLEHSLGGAIKDADHPEADWMYVA